MYGSSWFKLGYYYDLEHGLAVYMDDVLVASEAFDPTVFTDSPSVLMMMKV